MRKRVRLTFPRHLIEDLLAATTSASCGVARDIRRARVTGAGGEMVLVLEGTEEAIQNWIEFLIGKSADVEVFEGDFTE